MNRIVYDDINKSDSSSDLIKSILNEQIVFLYDRTTDGSFNKNIAYTVKDIIRKSFDVIFYVDPPNGFFSKMPILNSFLMYSHLGDGLYIFIHLFHFLDEEKGTFLLLELFEYTGSAIIYVQLNREYEIKTIELCKKLGFIEGKQNSNFCMNLEYYKESIDESNCDKY